MTIRVPLDGTNWADVKTPAEIMGSDIDHWEEFVEKIREVALGPEPEPVPDPENPAVMMTPERTGSFKASHVHRIRDELLAMTITAWSYDLPVPYEARYREFIPGPSCRKLDKAAGPAGRVLNDLSEDEDEDQEPDPKPESGSTAPGGSGDTSPESTESPLPESQPAP